MPDYYPVYLNLAGKNCVIIGGGTIAQGKVSGLLQAGCRITVISPDATPGIRQAHQRGDISWVQRPYQPGDLEGAFIGVAATNVWHVNREIYEEAERLGVLLNVVDDPDLCSFIAPSIVKREPVTLAISTGGASPALARKLRETLANAEALEWADLADVLAQARRIVKERRIAIDPERWQCCISRDLLNLVQDGRNEEALDTLLTQLLDPETPGMCSDLARCRKRTCQARTAQPGGAEQEARSREKEAVR
ncbi:MAG: bifunctional precorrin-2 dehydrogenase/sirohydrochlorin ferrochelatase [Chloroflexi bacterium]|nr:bifunctional precorrin-2 dehydrogenase/sirohydrochlorin ferrochelatase [Chloroflexota bacterium]